jgi:hypothetical protein
MNGVSFSMDQDRMTAVAQLWKAHRDAAFPARLRSTDVAGIEMVLLDADVAGCVSAWLDNGDMDDRRRECLVNRERDLARVVPELSGYEASYYQRLLDMTVMVLGTRGDSTSG